MGKHMNLEFGGAVAFLGDAGRAIYNAPSTKRSVNDLMIYSQDFSLSFKLCFHEGLPAYLRAFLFYVKL